MGCVEIVRFAGIGAENLRLIEVDADFAMRPEVIFIEPDRDRMSQLGIPPTAIIQELQAHNLAANAGRVEVGAEHITIEPTGICSRMSSFWRDEVGLVMTAQSP